MKKSIELNEKENRNGTDTKYNTCNIYNILAFTKRYIYSLEYANTITKS